jgi:hypothetical protein
MIPSTLQRANILFFLQSTKKKLKKAKKMTLEHKSVIRVYGLKSRSEDRFGLKLLNKTFNNSINICTFANLKTTLSHG